MNKIILAAVIILAILGFAVASYSDSNASVRYHERVQCEVLKYPGVNTDVLVVDKEFCENNLK
ncbi:hypothetical protein [Providencia phage PSTCR6]|nr:hypothetical protein [Providencia phage PSTCR6]